MHRGRGIVTVSGALCLVALVAWCGKVGAGPSEPAGPCTMTAATSPTSASTPGRRAPLGGARPASRTVHVYRDVPYRTVDGYALLLDAYIPDGGPHPAVLLIHGGGWALADKRDLATEGEELAAAGFAAFAVNYRLAPPGGTGHGLDPVVDLQTAVRCIRAKAEAYGVNPAKVGALGDSAGGHLAMMLGTTGHVGQDKVDAVVSWSGPSELRSLTSEPNRNMVTNYIGCALSDCPDRWDAASPLYHVDAHDAPMYLAHSREEFIPLDQATDMADKLEQAGVPYTLRIIDGTRHGIEYEEQVWEESVNFLQTHLGDGRSLGRQAGLSSSRPLPPTSEEQWSTCRAC
jgi:acetyl esterase/lipase